MKITDLIYRLVAAFVPRERPLVAMCVLTIVLTFATLALFIVTKASAGATAAAVTAGWAVKRYIR